MRVGDEVAAFVLQFESPGEDIEIPKEPKYNMYFGDVLGGELRSTRQTVSIEELAQQTGLVDYGESRAEIPGEDGKWVLIGHILVDRRERQFIGRKATLVSPEGKPIVQAAEVVAPMVVAGLVELDAAAVKTGAVGAGKQAADQIQRSPAWPQGLAAQLAKLGNINADPLVFLSCFHCLGK